MCPIYTDGFKRTKQKRELQMNICIADETWEKSYLEGTGKLK